MSLPRLTTTAVCAAALVVSVPTLSAPAVARTAGPSASYAYDREWAYSTGLGNPVEAIAVSPANRVHAAGALTTSNDVVRVRVYDTTGALQTTWDAAMPGVGGIEADAAGNVWMVEQRGGVGQTNDSVKLYSPQGQLSATYYLPDFARGEDLARSADGTLWVTDYARDVVHRFDAAGTYAGTLGAPGAGPGQFDAPWGVDVLPDGNLVVADSGNSRVQVLTPTGAVVAVWGQAGSADGQFVGGPRAVTTRDDGRVYVSDLSGVQVFTAAGQFTERAVVTTKAGNRVGGHVLPMDFGPDRAFYVAGFLGTVGAEGIQGVVRYVPTTRSLGKVGSAKKGLGLTKGRVVLKVSCPATATRCAGRARLTSPGKKPRTLTASAKYTITAGKAIRIRLELNKRGISHVRAHQRKAIVVLKATDLPTTRTKTKLRY